MTDQTKKLVATVGIVVLTVLYTHGRHPLRCHFWVTARSPAIASMLTELTL